MPNPLPQSMRLRPPNHTPGTILGIAGISPLTAKRVGMSLKSEEKASPLPSPLPEEKASPLPEEKPSSLPEEKASPLPEEKPSPLPEEKASPLPEEKPSPLPE